MKRYLNKNQIKGILQSLAKDGYELCKKETLTDQTNLTLEKVHFTVRRASVETLRFEIKKLKNDRYEVVQI